MLLEQGIMAQGSSALLRHTAETYAERYCCAGRGQRSRQGAFHPSLRFKVEGSCKHAWLVHPVTPLTTDSQEIASATKRKF
mmetsp:Transcript_101523/g.176232  ORF Transcript_101523/g.176232 Transcript_101523/m.176232 type:complete len:81 (+) Transcript_101523:47-289(+)